MTKLSNNERAVYKLSMLDELEDVYSEATTNAAMCHDSGFQWEVEKFVLDQGASVESFDDAIAWLEKFTDFNDLTVIQQVQRNLITLYDLRDKYDAVNQLAV